MRTCRYCNRTLQDTDFPLKPGLKRARYKVCRECMALGHSCIEKPKPAPRPKRTPEEQAEYKREYARRYREAHKEKLRELNRASYYRRKAGEPSKRGRKSDLTPEQRKERQKEYMRLYRQVRKRKEEEQKADMPKKTRTCVVCKRELPEDKFNSRNGKRTHSVVCLDCRPQPKPKAEPKPPTPKPKPKPVMERGCKKCWIYPCFDGIDNLETDFSLTCKSFKPR